ncbi:MAG: methyltransferase domain-containing protein [Bacteroidota bacterium]
MKGNSRSSNLNKHIIVAKSKIRQKLYAGNSVSCCICNQKFKQFKTSGWIVKKGGKCISCGARQRHRLLWKYLEQQLPKTLSNLKVLHFAPDKSLYERLSTFDFEAYISCDLFPENLHYIPKDKIVKVDITQIPYDENTFDIILCNHVLEHIPNDHHAMRELYRVMKVGGFGIFQVPVDYSKKETFEDFTITSPRGRKKAFGQFDHVRWYGRDYPHRLEAAGFIAAENAFVNSFSEKEIKYFGFDPKELIYHCTKT